VPEFPAEYDPDLDRLSENAGSSKLDAAAAEGDWTQQAKLSADPGAGQLALADFYHRRLRPPEEVHALEAAAKAPNLPAEKIRAALDDAGLKAIAAHVAIEPFEKDFDANVKFWKTVGNKDLAPGGMMNDCKDDLEAWLRGAKRLDTLGAKLREAGFRLSYHNHNFEFGKFPGDDRRKIDILMEATKPENLCAELDLAWVLVGGADPATYIRKYKGRCPTVHVKDVVLAKNGKKQHFTPLGQGEQNWPEIFAAGDQAGIEWYIYEQDSGEGSPFDFAHASYEFLAKHVKM